MKMFDLKKLLIGIFMIVAFAISFLSINFFNSTSYKILDWQVNSNADSAKILSLPDGIRSIDVSNIKRVDQYEAALIDTAVKAGMSRSEIKKIFEASDKQGPKGKIPVYIETDKLENSPVVIVVYKNAYSGPRSRLSDGQWVVIVKKQDYSVIFSRGSL